MRKIILGLFVLVLSAGTVGGSAGAQESGLPPINVTKEQIDAARMMYDSMNPAQKAALAEEVKRQAAAITPEQKAALIARAKTHYQSLTPWEQAALKARLLELGQSLTPEQRAEFLTGMDGSAAAR